MRQEVAQSLISKGWPIFHLLPKEKLPVSQKWTERTKAPPASTFEKMNCGVLTSEDFFVLDVDVKPGAPNGHQSLEMLEAEFGKLPETLKVTTPSGGAHYYFKHPKNEKIKSKKISYNGIFLGIETKGAGGYVVCPPSELTNGSYEFDNDTEIQDCPNWLLELVASPKKSDTKKIYVDAPERDHVARLLGFVDPDLDYDQWIRIGMALHSTGEDWALDVWDQWSSLGRKYKGTHETARHWNSFKNSGGVTMGTFYHIVSQFVPMPEFDLGSKVFDAPSEIVKKKNWELFSEVHDKSQGFMKEMIGFFLETSICPDPTFACAAAISLLHHICSLRIATASGDILTQFSVCDGASSGGKSSTFSPLRALLIAADKKQAMLKKPTSLKGMIRAFSKAASLFWIQDEWGGRETIEGFNGKERYSNEIHRAMLNLWSTGDQIEGTQQAKHEDDVETVYGPRLCTLFATQSNTMEELSKTDLYQFGGMARRLDIFKGDLNPIPLDLCPIKKATTIEIMGLALTEFIRWLDSLPEEAPTNGQMTVLVRLAPEVDNLRKALRDHCHTRSNALTDDDAQCQILRTMVQKVVRWATVHAVCDRRLTVEQVDWNYALALFDALHASYAAMTSGQNSPKEKARKSVLDYLAKKNGAQTCRNLTHNCFSFRKLTDLDRKNLLNQMIDDGEINNSKVGRSVVYSIIT